jgi:hypothetical protein
MEKMPYRSDGRIWCRTAERPAGACCVRYPSSDFRPLLAIGVDLPSSSACDASSSPANLERWSALLEISVGRERLVMLLHNTADAFSMSHRADSRAGGHPVTVV